MMTERPLSVKPLSSNHTRAAFSCGARRIDDYLQQGLAIQDARLARLFVAIDPADRKSVIGFYALHNLHIEADTVPLPFSSALRRGSMVGAVYIVMFAVDKKHQNQGIGALLFTHALRRARQVSEESGVWAVVLDALNERAERFYRRFGFETLVGNTARLFLPIDAIA